MVGEAVVQGLGWHNKDAEYVGFLRFDRKFCKRTLLTMIGEQLGWPRYFPTSILKIKISAILMNLSILSWSP